MRRRPSEGWIAGVCEGVARQLGVAPLLVRLTALFGLCLAPGLFGFGYLVGWCLMDSERERWRELDYRG